MTGQRPADGTDAWTGERPAHGVRSGRYAPRTRVPRGGPVVGRVAAALAILALAGALLWLLVSVVIGPAVNRVVFDFAESNPSLLHIGPVANIVRDRLGDELTSSAGTDPTVVHFTVSLGATAADVASDLQQAGLVRDQFAVTYLVVTRGLAQQIEAGAYDLNKTMTPAGILARLQQAPVTTVTVQLREGLRIEQITAYLETLPLKMDVQAFYELAMHPPASILSAYPFLSSLPAGRSLEGFLGAGTFDVYQDVTPEDLLKDLLDLWQTEIGTGPIEAAQKEGRDFYQVLSLASLVEQEARVASERPLIAGVYANRLARGMMLDADPTVIYGFDTVQLSKIPFADWKNYVFWNALPNPGAVKLPKGLAGFQTYATTGMFPGPLCTPSLASVEAALNPDTKTGYLYFVARTDGSHTHAFARTYAEQLANMRLFGYIQ
ncbi:MAG TPA: endolytic transglycosylase MltG [Candidatus Acidoferrales bacterium]|nr:endolytic transglycosylase MltG [Candidatus Acidoferrales bacterium]